MSVSKCLVIVRPFYLCGKELFVANVFVDEDLLSAK